MSMSKLTRHQWQADEVAKKRGRKSRLSVLIPDGWQLFTLFERPEVMDATTFLMQSLGVRVATLWVSWLRGWMVLVPAGTDQQALLAQMYPSQTQRKEQIAA